MLALVYFLLLIRASFIQGVSQCYFPDGSTSADVPCNSTASVSLCCGSPSACLTNGLCIVNATNDSGISFARGTCTDSTYTSTICPQHCLQNPDSVSNPNNPDVYNFGAGGVQVWQCDNDTHGAGYGSPANYCCESAAEKTRCCSTGLAVFSLAAASVGNPTSALFTSSTSAPVSSTSSPVSSTSTSVSSTSLMSSSALAPSTLSPSSPSVSGNRLDSGSKIALAVGITIGALAVASFAYFLWYKRRSKRSAEFGVKEGREGMGVVGNGSESKPSGNVELEANCVHEAEVNELHELS